MLSIKNLTFSYGNKGIFLDASISGFSKNDKIGIVGENGTGKSTLLKLINGDLIPEFGKITFEEKNFLIGYMKQEFSLETLESTKTILEYIKESSGFEKIENDINLIYEKLSDDYDEVLLNYLSELQDNFEKLGGYNFENNISYILGNLTKGKIKINTQIKNLSGGQKNKILLLEALVSGGDILLLDEPTNNLDFSSVNWLIDYLNELPSFVLIVSHDKYFLNELTNKTLEIKNKKIVLYSGNYEFYQLQKELEENKNESDYQKYIEKFNDLRSKLDDFKSKRQSTVRVKEGKDNDKFIPNFHRETAQNHHGKEIKKLKKELEILNKDKKELEKNKRLKFNLLLEEKVYTGIHINNLSFRYSDSFFGLNVEKFFIEKGEKVLIFGENGSGKSSFLKILIGDNKNYSGELNISPSIRIGNYSQEKTFLDKNEDTLFDYLNNNLPDKDISYINNILKTFNFSHEEKLKKVKLLSPGQKNRLLLGLFALAKYDTIILDEPTNHLDLEAIEELKNSLITFNGNLILVSHDKGFIDNISFDRYYKVDNGFLKEVFSIE